MSVQLAWPRPGIKNHAHQVRRAVDTRVPEFSNVSCTLLPEGAIELVRLAALESSARLRAPDAKFLGGHRKLVT